MNNQKEHLKQFLNTLEIKDIGNKAMIKLNDNDITKGVIAYKIERNANDNGIATLELKMNVAIDNIDMKLEKVNKRSYCNSSIRREKGMIKNERLL